MEQQYTCPFCFKDYDRFTIHQHYGCGVEPLETTEDIEQELDSISEEVAIEESVADSPEEEGLPTETIDPIGYEESTEKHPPSEALQAMSKEIGAELLEVIKQSYGPKTIELKPEPKKRGRKPKAK